MAAFIGRGAAAAAWRTGASVGAIALCAIALPAAAQDVGAANPVATQPPQTQESSSAPAGEIDQDLIVTARRVTESLQNVPVAVQAIGGATLQKYAVADVTSIAQLVPSMVVGRQASGSSASIFLRGVGSTSLSSGFDQSVSLNLDGLAMSRGKELLTAQYDLSRVEVLKGPQALFFGKNSTGGVVTLTSADPTDEFELGVKLGYEIQAQEMYGEHVISGPITDKLKARFAFRGSDSIGPYYNTAQANSLGGLFRPVISDRRGAATTKAGRITLRYDDPDVVNITLKASLTQQDDDSASALYERKCGQGRTTPRPTGGVPEIYSDCRINGRAGFAYMPAQIAAAFPYARSDGKPYTDYDAYTAVLTLDRSFGPVTVTSITGQYGFRQQDLQSAAGSTAGVYFSQRNKLRQFSQEFRVATDFDGPFDVSAGAYYADQHYTFNTAAQAGPVIAPTPGTGRYDNFFRVNGIDGKSYSAFAELKYDILETLELAGGARYSREEKDSFSQNTYATPGSAFANFNRLVDNYRENNVSPQATLTWRATPDVTLYGAYKQGFKAGGFNTSISILTTSTVANGQFGSETAEGFEAGLRTTSFDRQLRFNVTAYTYGYNDLQVQFFDAATTASVVNNAGQLRTKGVEAELNFRPTGSGFEAHAQLAYNDARFHDYIGACYAGQTRAEGCLFGAGPTGNFNNQDYENRIAPKAPQWAGRAGASYEGDVGGGWRFGVNGDVQFSSSYNYTDTLRPDGVQPAFQRYDAGIRLFREDNRWEVAVIGRNLTNEYVVTTANDMPAQGAGGTGAPATVPGIRSDMNAIVDRPRSIFLQTSFRF